MTRRIAFRSRSRGQRPAAPVGPTLAIERLPSRETAFERSTETARQRQLRAPLVSLNPFSTRAPAGFLVDFEKGIATASAAFPSLPRFAGLPNPRMPTQGQQVTDVIDARLLWFSN